jgi:hypothetical protein
MPVATTYLFSPGNGKRWNCLGARRRPCAGARMRSVAPLLR